VAPGLLPHLAHVPGAEGHVGCEAVLSSNPRRLGCIRDDEGQEADEVACCGEEAAQEHDARAFLWESKEREEDEEGEAPQRLQDPVQEQVVGRNMEPANTKVNTLELSLGIWPIWKVQHRYRRTVKRGKIGHLLKFKSKLKIVKSIFWGFFLLKSLYELWDL
jgi:hypothetical protein